jgi:uncharacterized membrane protein YdjX (TVP38/TMEM64 family)
MKKLIAVFIFCCLLVIVTFLLFGNIEKWVEINLQSKQHQATYALLSFSILASDILLPIPSSLVMILNGKVLGVFAGTSISLLSGVLSSCIGFYLGRKANPLLDKLFTNKDKEISNTLFQKFGNVAITISKALPIISEAISFVSGTTAISFKTFLLYSIVGHFIVALIYACVGIFASTLSSSLIAAIIIVAALLIGWVTQLMIRQKSADKKSITSH